MFALAWKSVRQVRWASCLAAAILLAIYGVSALTPWSALRGVVLFVAACVIGALVGSLSFSEDRRGGTQVFLASLPVGGLRRWGATVLASLAVMALSTGAFFAVALVVDRGVDLSFVEPWMIVPLAAMMLLVWSAATFYSTLFESAVIAMIAAVVTLPLGVALMGVMAHFFDANVQQGFTRVAEGAWRRAMWGPGPFTLAVVVPAAVFLAGSLVFHGGRVARRGIAARVAAVMATVVVAFVAASGVHVGRIVALVTHAEMARARQSFRGFDAIGAAPDRESVLVFHDGRLRRWSPAAGWRTYSAPMDGLAHAPGAVWVLSPDGKTLLVERRPDERPTTPAIALLAARALLFGTPFNPLNPGGSLRSRRERLLLDLKSGDVRTLRLPRLKDTAVLPLGWRGEPATLYVAAIHYDDTLSGVGMSDANAAGMEILTLSEEGDLVDTIRIPEIDSFIVAPMPSRGGIERGASTSVWPQLEGDLLYAHKVRWEPAETPAGRPFRGPAYLVTLVTNLKTGESRRVDPSSSPGVLAVSPDLDWQLTLDPQSLAAWEPRGHLADLRRYGRATLFPRDGAGATAPGAVRLQGASSSALVSLLSADAREVRIDFEFVGDNVFFALVTEVAKEGTPGFERVRLAMGPPGSTEMGAESRRVRAVAVDLDTGQRQETALPAEVSFFLVDPDCRRVIAHGLRRSGETGAPAGNRCVVLDLPGLANKATYQWPEGEGPWLGMVGHAAAFLKDDTLALSRWDGISLWKIGPEPPRVIPFPDSQNAIARNQ